LPDFRQSIENIQIRVIFCVDFKLNRQLDFSHHASAGAQIMEILGICNDEMMDTRKNYYGMLRQSSGAGNQLHLHEAQYLHV
jgi:hypothetical protein